MGEDGRRAFVQIAHRGRIEMAHLYTLLGIGLQCFVNATTAVTS